MARQNTSLLSIQTQAFLFHGPANHWSCTLCLLIWKNRCLSYKILETNRADQTGVRVKSIQPSGQRTNAGTAPARVSTQQHLSRALTMTTNLHPEVYFTTFFYSPHLFLNPHSQHLVAKNFSSSSRCVQSNLLILDILT